MASFKQQTTSLAFKVKEKDIILSALEELRNHEKDINWVALHYNDCSEVELLTKGSGGIGEVKAHLPEDKTVYYVIEVLIKGDDGEYNSVKYSLVTWIGPKVSHGLGKARCASHRPQIISLAEERLAIAGEFQPTTVEDFEEALAAKLTRVANQETAESTSERHALSRSTKKGDNKKANLEIGQAEDARAALLAVHKGGPGSWTALTYVGRDEVGCYASGQGGFSDEALQNLPTDKVVFIIYKLQYEDASHTYDKVALITWVGENVKPLVKARSSAQRGQMAEYVQSVMPFHTHFPASSVEDLNEKDIIAKLS